MKKNQRMKERMGIWLYIRRIGVQQTAERQGEGGILKPKIMGY